MKDNGAMSFTEGSEPIKLTPPTWYNENQIYHWLIRENYSEHIAKELSKKWADDLQGAFNKGFEKALKESKQQLKEERNKAIDLFREVLTTLQSKEAEYKECLVEGNINLEYYFKGKAYAYGFAVKQLRRVFDWYGESLKSDSK